MRGTPRWREVSPLEAGHLLDTAGEEGAESQVPRWTRHVGGQDASDPTRWPQLTYPEHHGLSDPSECQKPKATEKPPSNLPADRSGPDKLSAELPGWGREGAAMSAQPSTGASLGPLCSTPFPLAIAPGSSTPGVGNPGVRDTQEPSFPQVRGAGPQEAEQRPGGRNSPNRPPLVSKARGVGVGVASRWEVAAPSLPLSLLRHAGNSSEANARPRGWSLHGRADWRVGLPRGPERPGPARSDHPSSGVVVVRHAREVPPSERRVHRLDVG